MNSEDVTKMTELKQKITDVLAYIETLSYTKNLFNHVNLTTELLNALVTDLDQKLATDVNEKKAAEEQVTEDKAAKKKVKAN